jgi:hypothetical protein
MLKQFCGSWRRSIAIEREHVHARTLEVMYSTLQRGMASNMAMIENESGMDYVEK